MKFDPAHLSLSELRTYVLEHRDDQDAFHALMDRIDAQPAERVFSREDLDRFPELLAEHLRLEGKHFHR